MADNRRMVQPRFYLGTDKRDAELRRIRLQQLWESIEALARATNQPAIWHKSTLDIADAIRNGQNTYPVQSAGENETIPEGYTSRVDFMNKVFKGIVFVPADSPLYAKGDEQRRKTFEGLKSLTNFYADQVKAPRFTTDANGTLHEAIEAYAKHIRATTVIPATSQTSPHGVTYAGTVERLKDNHSEIPLSQFGYAQIEAMANYWKRRPCRKGTNRPISVDTVEGQIGELRRLIKWTSKYFDWRKPEDWEDATKLSRQTLMTGEEKAAKATPHQVKTYSVPELVTIYGYCTELERTIILLALNNAFGAAEISTLRLNELNLEAATIKRIRGKSGVYGEQLLWPETVEHLRRAVTRRKQDGQAEACTTN